MTFKLLFTNRASSQLNELQKNSALKKRFKAVRKALGHLEINPKHPSLNTHKYTELSRKLGKEIFEVYAENHTPQAYRVFWHYGPSKDEITIIAIIPHP